MRVEESFAEVNLQQQFLLPVVSCVFGKRWGIPTHGTRSRIAHESKNQSIEYADRASSQELVLVSSLLVAIQFPTKHFIKSYEGRIMQQASRFAQSKPFVQRDSLDELQNKQKKSLIALCHPSVHSVYSVVP